MRGFRPYNIFHYFNTLHPKPNELFSGSVMEQILKYLIYITRKVSVGNSRDSFRAARALVGNCFGVKGQPQDQSTLEPTLCLLQLTS